MGHKRKTSAMEAPSTKWRTSSILLLGLNEKDLLKREETKGMRKRIN
jgi:hypothetical protein